MKNKKKILISLLLVMAILVSGAYAFLTAQDSKVNKFVMGKAEIELWEGFDADLSGSVQGLTITDGEKEYVKANTTDEVYGPDEEVPAISNMMPTEWADKKPWVENSGSTSVYTYLWIGFPYYTNDDYSELEFDDFQAFIPYHYEGESLVEGFNNDWDVLQEVIVERPIMEEETQVGAMHDMKYYLVAYKNIVEAGETTTPAFDKVLFSDEYSYKVADLKVLDDNYNLVENDYGIERYIPINAYAIQGDLGYASTYKTAWEAYSKQENWEYPLEGCTHVTFIDDATGNIILRKYITENSNVLIPPVPSAYQSIGNCWQDSEGNIYCENNNVYIASGLSAAERTFTLSYMAGADETRFVFKRDGYEDIAYSVKVGESVTTPTISEPNYFWVRDGVNTEGDTQISESAAGIYEYIYTLIAPHTAHYYFRDDRGYEWISYSNVPDGTQFIVPDISIYNKNYGTNFSYWVGVYNPQLVLYPNQKVAMPLGDTDFEPAVAPVDGECVIKDGYIYTYNQATDSYSVKLEPNSYPGYPKEYISGKPVTNADNLFIDTPTGRNDYYVNANITSLNNAFPATDHIKTIHYAGTKEQWLALNIDLPDNYVVQCRSGSYDYDYIYCDGYEMQSQILHLTFDEANNGWDATIEDYWKHDTTVEYKNSSVVNGYPIISVDFTGADNLTKFSYTYSSKAAQEMFDNNKFRGNVNDVKIYYDSCKYENCYVGTVRAS